MVDLYDSERLRHRETDPPSDVTEKTSLDRRAAPRKKLTIEISADLHRRILMICSTRHVPVNQAVRDVLERAFPGA